MIINIICEGYSNEWWFTKDYRDLPMSLRKLHSEEGDLYYFDLEIDEFLLKKAKNYNLSHPDLSFPLCLVKVSRNHTKESEIDKLMQEIRQGKY